MILRACHGRSGELLATLGLGLLLALTRSAAGHAIVLESRPAHEAVLAQAPAEVVLRFNSKIEHGLARVTLASRGEVPVPVAVPVGGAAVHGGPARLAIPLPPLGVGTYVLHYRVLSADGHLTDGALRFTVRPGS